MATIFIDNVPYEVEKGRDLLSVCLSLGFDIPYFCWHPALNSVGACRQCAVKCFRDEKDTRGHIVMSCMTAVEDGMRISVEDPEVKEFRAHVIEWLMLNHPHDCPVCDEGGECHLQDMTVMTGHAYRETRFPKRTYINQDLGPFVSHEMNRCIQCYRCVRFYRGYAGGRDFNVFGAHANVYFGRCEDGTLENEFSGNLVEICPTGVFTDKTQKKHYTRSWDLQTAPSVCVHCGIGCNTIPGDRYGELRRIRSRFNREVNGYFLCDRGRFGYEFVNGNRRIRKPLLRRESCNQESPRDLVERDTALRCAATTLNNAHGIIGIGSPRAPLEANFLLRKLVGPENFYLGVSDTDFRLVSLVLDILRNGPARAATLHDLENADAALILGEDVTNTAPMMALALRQSVLRKTEKQADALAAPRWSDAAVRRLAKECTGPFFIATPTATKLDDVATERLCGAPPSLARLGFAVAHLLDPQAPDPDGLPAELLVVARRIAEELKSAERPVIVSGTGLNEEALVQAAANVASALGKAGREALLAFAVPECNSMGLAMLGGGRLSEAFDQVRAGKADTAIILENDLYRRSDKEAVTTFLQSCKSCIVVDHVLTDTAMRADLVLPAGTFADSDGTLVSNEGRGQRFFQVIGPKREVQESWRWIRDLMVAMGRQENAGWQALDDVVSSIAAELPAFAGLTEIAPPAAFRATGMKIPRQTGRFSGRTAMRADVRIHETKPPDDPDSSLSFSMEGYGGHPPPALAPRFWAPGWNSVQAINKFQIEVNGPLRGGDPGRRLIEPPADASPTYFDKIPETFVPRPGEWFVVPLQHIFGSEELSVLSPAVAARAPGPYLALSPTDCEAIGVTGGDEVDLVTTNGAHVLRVKIEPAMPCGVAGFPVGLPGSPWIELPTWSMITKRASLFVEPDTGI